MVQVQVCVREPPPSYRIYIVIFIMNISGVVKEFLYVIASIKNVYDLIKGSYKLTEFWPKNIFRFSRLNGTFSKWVVDVLDIYNFALPDVVA